MADGRGMTRFSRAAALLERGAQAVAALLMAALFLSFLLNVFLRYAVNAPAGWTSEVSTIAWLLAILWGAALVLRDPDEIRFDIVVSAAGPRTTRAFRIAGSLAVLVLYAWAMPATVDYVLFMRVEKTAYLDIRFDWLYAIYLLFAGAVILRRLAQLVEALRGRTPAPGPS